MKTKHNSLATVSLGVDASNNEEILTSATPHSVKNRLRVSIRLALAGSILASSMATAALQDFGGIADNSGIAGLTPATLNWPAWYRDGASLPLGLCKSQAVSPGGAGGEMCFPIEPNPAGFAGNVGDEIFYTNLNANIANGGIDLRYVTALEAAYASGSPVKGQEMVFARVRFVMSVTGAACAGTYRIIHPWGESTFEDVPVGPRALFETVDIGIAPLDFAGALPGSIGPFLHWDGNGDENPLLRTVANGLKVGTAEFVGDPNVEHSYTGSPFIETLDNGVTPRYRLADGTPQHQNYLKVIAPAACDIGGTPAPAGEGINVQKQQMGFLLGQVWTAPIATATKVTQATFTRTSANTTVDVWAETIKTTPAQRLQVTGNNLPGVVMTAVTDGGVQTGKYQAHIVLPADAALPSSISVVNSTSTPVLKVSANLSDIVNISKAEYNPSTGNLCVSAGSSDNQTLTLTVDSNPLTAQLDSTVKVGCPAAGNELTAMAQYPLNRAPNTVRVVSQLSGSSEKQVTVLANTPDNTATLVANADTFLNISGSGAQVVDVGANDGANGLGSQTGEIIIVDQPGQPAVDPDGQPITQIVGTATGSLTGGTATFTANPGAAGVATFSYFVKNGNNVSNLVNATVDITFVPGQPTGNTDNFAVFRSNTAGFTTNVLQNDTAAVGTTINTGSVAITQQGTRGVATANLNGTVTYIPNAGVTAGTDAFFYTVANTVGTASAPIRVDVVVENTQETISITRNRYTASSARWDLRMTTPWFGAPLTSTGSCYLVRVGATTIPTPRFIGSITVDALGAAQIAVTGTKAYNAANYTANDRPIVPVGSYTIRCGSSNAVTALPAASAQTADNTTSTR